MTATEFLSRSVALFQGLDEDMLHSLSKNIDEQTFSKGQTVLFRGTTVDGLHVVATGKVGVFAKPEKSHAVVQIAELGPGEVFGEMSILAESTASATVKCAEDGTTIFVIPQSAFKALISFNPDFQARTEALIAERKAKKPEAPAPAPAA